MVKEAVYRSCAIKGHFVINDEHENGQRAKLNYGHTFGHALEGETAYQRYLHGEAVAIGMRMAAVAAEEIGHFADPDLIPAKMPCLQRLSYPSAISWPMMQRLTVCLPAALGIKRSAPANSVLSLPQRMGVVDIVTNPDPAAFAAGFEAGCVAARWRNLAECPPSLSKPICKLSLIPGMGPVTAERLLAAVQHPEEIFHLHVAVVHRRWHRPRAGAQN